MAKNKIVVEGIEIKSDQSRGGGYYCITDIAKQVDSRSEQVIQNWIRNASTLDYLYEWEMEYNHASFDDQSFQVLRQQAGKVGFVLTPKRWVETTNAIGLFSKAGRGGGTYAHKYIALEFSSAVSARFKLMINKEFDRLKTEEAVRTSIPWSSLRELAKINYYIHTDAVREGLVPHSKQHTKKESLYFASEADLLNIVVFGMTAKQWRQAPPKVKGNIRDDATKQQLLDIANLEVINAKLIEWDCDQEQRLEILTKTVKQHRSILGNRKLLEGS